MRLGVAIDIGIRVHTLQVALHHIRRQEDPHHGVIVTGIQVIQPRAVVVLPDEAFGGVDIACEVPIDAIGSEELVAFERGCARRVVEVGDNATQRVDQVELRAVAVQRA